MHITCTHTCSLQYVINMLLHVITCFRIVLKHVLIFTEMFNKICFNVLLKCFTAGFQAAKWQHVSSKQQAARSEQQEKTASKQQASSMQAAKQQQKKTHVDSIQAPSKQTSK